MGAVSAAALYAAATLVLLGVRSWRQRRATGTSGFTGLRGARTTEGRIAAASFVLATLSGLVSPVLAGLGVLPVLRLDPGPLLGLAMSAAVVLTVAGIALGLAAQQAMGTSWRIGVDPDERTDLVTDGLFAWVRNPIFTAVVMIQVGTAALAPTLLALVGAVALLLACQLQVRAVEEPHLLAAHGSGYSRYGARTGRFMPSLGRRRRTARSRLSTR